MAACQTGIGLFPGGPQRAAMPAIQVARRTCSDIAADLSPRLADCHIIAEESSDDFHESCSGRRNDCRISPGCLAAWFRPGTAPREPTVEAMELRPYDLAIRYAKVNLDLAEVELQRAPDMNANTSGVIPKLTVERLRTNLAVVRQQFQQAQLASTGEPAQVRLRHVAEKIRLSQMDLQAGQELLQQGAINALELQRLTLKNQLARLSLRLMKNPEDRVTRMDSMQQQVDRLGEEILSLDQRLTRLEPDLNQ